MSILGIGAMAAGAAANIYSSISANKNAEKAATKQFERQKELMDISQRQQKEMWDKTNIGAQKKHIEDAGMNAGLLYGGGGAGGGTVGSSGAPSAGKADVQKVDTSGIMELGIMAAQKKLLEAQAEKEVALTEKARGVDTAVQTEEAKSKAFNNSVNELITKEGYMTKWSQQTQKEGVETDKSRDEYEAWKKGSFDGKATDDDTPMSRAIRANLEKATVELKNAKAEGDVKRAEAAIKGFEQDLAERGIDPKSPWWGRYIGRLLQTIGVMTNME